MKDSERIARYYEEKWLTYDLQERIREGKENLLALKKDGVDFTNFTLNEKMETFDLTPKVAEILEAEYRVLLWGEIEILGNVREADAYEVCKELEIFAKVIKEEER